MDEPPKPGKGPKPLGDRKSVLSSDLNFSSLGARLSGYLWKHRRRVLFLSVFSAGYFCVVQGVRSGQRDLLRAGLAGASANMICEMSFHTFDTINTRTKVHHTPISSIIMLNEVLARLASDASGEPVHPNDHVNCSQSSNDVIPSCILVSSARQLQETLLPALQALKVATTRRGEELSAVTKTGRTHLMDAMPLTFGQEMSAWVSQLEECQQRLLAVPETKPRRRLRPSGRPSSAKCHVITIDMINKSNSLSLLR